jgi:tetratricopeptide (TPR) repeat protein
MGFFSIFQKSAEDMEAAGDRCFSAGDYGSAKIEYDRALERAEKKSPEKAALIRRLTDKCRQSCEALAGAHLKTAGELSTIGTHDAEALELINLALELSRDAALKKNLAVLHHEISGKRKFSSHGLTEDADPMVPEEGAPFMEDGEEEEDDDEYFSILCSTLPDEIRDAYEEYGAAFKHGYTALNQGDFETAVERLEEAMEAEADPDGFIPLELATALINLGRYDTARRLMEPYAARHPEAPRAYQILCEIYWEQQAYEQAVSLLAKSPAGIQTSIQIHLLMGETLYLMGDYPAAIRVFSTWLDDNGYHEIMARSLAKTLEADGRIQAARDLYAQIIRGCAACGSRTDPFIRRRYAELCYQSGDRSKKLLDLFLSLSQEDPDNNREYYSRITELYENMGDVREARRFQAMAEAFTP